MEKRLLLLFLYSIIGLNSFGRNLIFDKTINSDIVMEITIFPAGFEESVGKAEREWYVIKIYSNNTYYIRCNRTFPPTSIIEPLTFIGSFSLSNWRKLKKLNKELKEATPKVFSRSCWDCWEVLIKYCGKEFRFDPWNDRSSPEMDLFRFIQNNISFSIYLRAFS